MPGKFRPPPALLAFFLADGETKSEHASFSRLAFHRKIPANSRRQLLAEGETETEPLMLAAGTAGYIDELAEATNLARIGAVVTKSITDQPRRGNPTWRVVETTGGMLNAIGLANVGKDRFASEYAPRAHQTPCAVIGSIAGHSVAEYIAVAEMFDAVEAIPAVELNVSCPNVERGSAFGESPDCLEELVESVRLRLTRTKLIVKLPPVTVGVDSPDAGIVALARSAIDAGADALTIANTIPAMAIDVESRRPALANVVGGLSGPAVHPIAVRLVRAVYIGVARDASVPIIGAGGVLTWKDAAEFILAGASAVQMGTALFIDPRSPVRVAQGLERWFRRQGAENIHELVGAMREAEQSS